MNVKVCFLFFFFLRERELELMSLWKDMSEAEAFWADVFINVWTKHQILCFDTDFFNPVKVESVWMWPSLVQVKLLKYVIQVSAL